VLEIGATPDNVVDIADLLTDTEAVSSVLQSLVDVVAEVDREGECGSFRHDG